MTGSPADEETIDEIGALTAAWEQTWGLEDREIDAARTVTMRPPTRLQDSRPARQLPRLPRLMESGEGRHSAELQIKGTIGRGGMGFVELAEQLSLGRDVAVKRVRDDARSPESTVVLLREGWATGILEHPNIVPVYTLGRNADGEPVIVMKRIEGTAWLDVIREPATAPQHFEHDDPLELHVEILAQVCNAVHYAHSRGIIHRDLKPENVMLGEFGEVYVLDWGIAVALEPDPTGRLADRSQIEGPAGTPAYMAPEMTRGAGEDLGVHTDIYLLGAILCEVLTGRPPHIGETVFQLMIAAHRSVTPTFPEGTPPELAAICRRAMARDPEDRFESVEALREALVEYRRKRESRRLAARGDESLEQLGAMLERDGASIEENDLYRTFGECRFAYEQALEVASDNLRAREGLQHALEMMAAREIEREAHQAAALLVADLPKPNEELQARLAELAERMESRQQEFEQLQQIRHETDADVGREPRTIVMLALGTFWASMASGLAVLLELDLFELTYRDYLLHEAVLIVVMVAVLYFGRKWLMINAINRRLWIGLTFLLVTSLLLRLMAWLAEVPLHFITSTEMLMFGAGGSVLAIALDRRAIVAALPYVVLGVVSSLFPQQVFWFFAFCNLFGVLLLGLVWWPGIVGDGSSDA